MKNFKNSLVGVSCSYVCMELGILFDTNKLLVNIDCSKFLGHENTGFWSIKAMIQQKTFVALGIVSLWLDISPLQSLGWKLIRYLQNIHN